MKNARKPAASAPMRETCDNDDMIVADRRYVSCDSPLRTATPTHASRQGTLKRHRYPSAAQAEKSASSMREGNTELSTTGIRAPVTAVAEKSPTAIASVMMDRKTQPGNADAM